MKNIFNVKCLVLSADKTTKFVVDFSNLVYKDYLKYYNGCKILSQCNEKGTPITNRFGVDLSKYDDDDSIYCVFCKTCPRGKECHEEREIPSYTDCDMSCFCDTLKGIEDKDHLLDEMFFDDGLYFKAFILFDPDILLYNGHAIQETKEDYFNGGK